MNYGFPPTPFDAALFKAISAYVKTLPVTPKRTRARAERNGRYPGVRIRNLTHYSPEQLGEIVKTADSIYNECEAAWEAKKLSITPYGANPLDKRYFVQAPELEEALSKKQKAFYRAARYALSKGVTASVTDLQARSGAPEVWEFFMNGTSKVSKYAEKKKEKNS